MRTRWRHQRGKAGHEFEQREAQLVGPNTSLCVPMVAMVAMVASRLAVLLGAAVNALTVRLAQPIQRKRWPRTEAQQALQPRSLSCAAMRTLVSNENPQCL